MLAFFLPFPVGLGLGLGQVGASVVSVSSTPSAVLDVLPLVFFPFTFGLTWPLARTLGSSCKGVSILNTDVNP